MLVGINCPFKGKVSLEDCTKCAERFESQCNYPYEIVAGIRSFNEEERGQMVSPSAITGCMRKTYLGRTNDYYEALDSLYWSFRGQLAHGLCERFKHPSSIVEKRYVRTLPSGLKISGKPDAIYPEQKLIRDWKTTRAVPKYETAYPNHEEQVNCYRYILAKPDEGEPIEVDSVKVTYLAMDRTKTVPAKMWPMKDIERFINENGEILQRAFDTGEVPPVPEEYPNYKLCDYCPDEIKKICSSIYRMGQKS